MVTIRPGKLSDIDKVVELHEKTWQDCYKKILPISFLNNPDIPMLKKKHMNDLNNGINYFIAQNFSGNIIGFASYGNTRFEKMQSDRELYTIYVDTNVQRKGIGTLLLNTIFKNIGNISLGVITMVKSPYKSFYEKNGFTVSDYHIMKIGGIDMNNIIYIKKPV